MTESFKPSIESEPKPPTPEQIYKKLPTAEARVFNAESEIPNTECLLFPPVTISIIPDFFDGNEFFTEDEKKLFKLSKETVSGDFEVACCSRMAGDTNRIDKMIKELDPDNPWEPAKLEHLIVFREAHSEILLENPIVAFGTEQKQHRPRLNGKELVRHYSHAGYNSDLLFLIVRRKS